MIIKWEKGLFKALGLHHAAYTLAVIIGLFLLLGPKGALLGYGFMCGVYYYKELRENGKEFEILDLLSPVIFGGGLTYWIIQ